MKAADLKAQVEALPPGDVIDLGDGMHFIFLGVDIVDPNIRFHVVSNTFFPERTRSFRNDVDGAVQEALKQLKYNKRRHSKEPVLEEVAS